MPLQQEAVQKQRTELLYDCWVRPLFQRLQRLNLVSYRIEVMRKEEAVSTAV
jgi:sigma54-dependent transcription regulator